MMSCPAKFKIGQHVNHPAACDNSFPAGCGVVTEATPFNNGTCCGYRVKCDATGVVLPCLFTEDELSSATPHKK